MVANGPEPLNHLMTRGLLNPKFQRITQILRVGTRVGKPPRRLHSLLGVQPKISS